MDTLTTIAAPDAKEPDREEGLHLLITAPDLFAACPLPDSGSVLVGRSTVAQVNIKDPLASRHHARLYLGPTLTVEDLGSANGTRVRDVPIPPNQQVPIAPGEAISIGSTLLIVRRSRWTEGTQIPWSHERFEADLQARCERAVVTGRPFALIRLKLGGTVAWPRILLALARAIPGRQPFAPYGPNEYEALVPDVELASLDALVDSVKRDLESLGIRVTTGVAVYPRDGRSADALLSRANAQLRPAKGRGVSTSGERRVVRTSPAMQQVYDMASRAAVANINVLLLGETGVGKELLANWVHRSSGRADKPMVSLNCGGLSETLIESELFGHEKGAFTGAVQAQVGLLESAHGGTVFLDEIGEMSLKVQAALLRVLETREVMPVGGRRTRSIDVRFIAATHRDLEADCVSGRFRQDLYFRLCGISLSIPPLRERASELPELIRLLLDEAGATQLEVAPEAMALLEGYAWPGNIRELKNVMERAVVLCDSPLILPRHLPVERFRARATVETKPETRAEDAPDARGERPVDGTMKMQGQPIAPPPRPLTEWQEIERQKMIEALNATNWNQSRAARQLGIPRRTFVARLDQYGLPRPQKSAE